MFQNPGFSKCSEGVRILDKLVDFGRCGDPAHVVVHLVSLSTADLKRCRVGGDGLSHGRLDCLESRLMVPCAGRFVAGASDDHGAGLECSVVGRCKTSVVRQLFYRGVVKVTLYDRS